MPVIDETPTYALRSETRKETEGHTNKMKESFCGCGGVLSICQGISLTYCDLHSLQARPCILAFVVFCCSHPLFQKRFFKIWLWLSSISLSDPSLFSVSCPLISWCFSAFVNLQIVCAGAKIVYPKKSHFSTCAFPTFFGFCLFHVVEGQTEKWDKQSKKWPET